jgi:hypothetical protein
MINLLDKCFFCGLECVDIGIIDDGMEDIYELENIINFSKLNEAFFKCSICDFYTEYKIGCELCAVNVLSNTFKE